MRRSATQFDRSGIPWTEVHASLMRSLRDHREDRKDGSRSVASGVSRIILIGVEIGSGLRRMLLFVTGCYAATLTNRRLTPNIRAAFQRHDHDVFPVEFRAAGDGVASLRADRDLVPRGRGGCQAFARPRGHVLERRAAR